MFLVACYATLHPALSVRRSVGPSVRPSVRRSVQHTLLFLGFWDFLLQCSCPNDLLTSITAPAHPHATGVAVYPALFFSRGHATLHLAVSVGPLVRNVFELQAFFALPLLPNRSRLSRRVFGLVSINWSFLVFG